NLVTSLEIMKGSDIGIQEKKAKLFNEWETFTSNEGESIESYYHHFLKLMNDLKRNKHFPKKIASNMKFLNNLQPEWCRHVTIVHQTKDLHTADYTQLYDFLKYNQKEVDELKAKQLVKTQDSLALMVNSNNPYAFPAPHQDLSSFNQNYLQQPMPNPEDITDPTTAMNMALTLMAKVFKLNYSTPTNNNQRISSNPRNRAECRESDWNVGNQNGLIGVQGNGNQNQIRNGNLVAARAKGNAAGQNRNQIRCYNCRGVGFKSLAKDIDESLAKHKALEFKRLLRAVVSQDIISVVQKESVVDTSDLQTDLERTKERFENCIIKKENEYAKLWNDWYKKYTRNPLSQKLESKNVELEFQVLNYARENGHLKATYKNLFDSIFVSRTQTKRIITSLQNELQYTIYKNAKLRTQLFKKVFDQKDNTHDTSANTKFAKQPIMENLTKIGETHALSKPVTSNFVSTPQEPKVVKNDK
nr:hypothetical protein [Tanacetum cinerariifolium]